MADILDPSIEEMIPRLLTLDQAREKLASTEPLQEFKFEAQKGVSFRLGANWDTVADTSLGSDRMDAWVQMFPGGDEFQLTKDALLEAGAKVGIPRKLQERTPSHLLQDQLNWWFGGRSGWEGREFKGFVQGETGPDTAPVVIAFGSATISPFSNMQIFDQLVGGIREFYRNAGDRRASEQDLFVDYKFTHSLELTHGRIVVPGYVRNVRGPGTANPVDMWSTGVQWRNSQLGLKPVSVDGYLFRWRCTNGMTDTLVTSGQFNRRAKDDSAGDVYSWARAAVDNVLGGLEQSLDGVSAATQIPVEQDVQLVLDDLFRQHTVPTGLRQQIIGYMAETGGALSMYTIMNAITSAANDPELSPSSVDKLLRTGGHVAHSASLRCETCRRIKPEEN